jgi:hypothetical protein
MIVSFAVSWQPLRASLPHHAVAKILFSCVNNGLKSLSFVQNKFLEHSVRPAQAYRFTGVAARSRFFVRLRDDSREILLSGIVSDGASPSPVAACTGRPSRRASPAQPAQTIILISSV